MIFLLSDLHGKLDFEGLNSYLACGKEDDLLIILGDLGLKFENTAENKNFTEGFLKITKNIAIVDGNHENFSFLSSFPEEELYGSKIRRLTDHIILLQRGNVYRINGKSFFVFGGCKSSPKWKEQGLWHPGDEPSDSELERAYASLEKNRYRVDYVLTHKYEQTPGVGTVCEKLQQLNCFIDENVSFKLWYAGHWHKNGAIDEKHLLVYDKLVQLEQ